MRVVTKTGSKRKLTYRYLIVDWQGNNNLLYKMTKAEMRKVFSGAKTATVSEQLYDDTPDKVTFDVTRSNGSLSIGCESFTKDEVKELKQWSKK